MPSRRVHLKFDEYLIARGVVYDRNFNIVHNRMDRLVREYGSAHRTLDEYHSEEGIRYSWLSKW